MAVSKIEVLSGRMEGYENTCTVVLLFWKSPVDSSPRKLRSRRQERDFDSRSKTTVADGTVRSNSRVFLYNCAWYCTRIPCNLTCLPCQV
jgi:hypothetical protein